MQQLTGINAIVTSASTIVSSVIPNLQNDVPLIINAVQLVATIVPIFMLTKVGRKPLTLFGNLGLAVIDIALGILFVFQDDWQPAGMFIFALLIVYMIIYGVSLGPVVWLYVPEIIPANIVPMATMMNWFGCSLCVIFSPIVTSMVGNSYPVFFFYGGLTLIFFIINVFLMVETKGKTTE
jgi:hypothetical protein